MEANELKELLTKHIEENHKLLQENNALLRKIIEQNNLIFTITQKNIRYYSNHWLWSEGDEVKKLKRELNAFYKELME